MDEQRPQSLLMRGAKALARLGLAIAIFAVISPAPASSVPLLEKCPSVGAISI